MPFSTFAKNAPCRQTPSPKASQKPRSQFHTDSDERQKAIMLWVFFFVFTAAAGSNATLDRLLQVLQGVPRGPRSTRQDPPRYMVDLYKSVAAPDGLTMVPTPYSANVVRCYADKEFRHQSHFFFNVSSDKTDKLLQAEFHVFKMKPRAKELKKAKMLKSQLLEVKVYQALPPSKTKRKRKKRLLETRRLSVHSTGWEIFSVKVAVSDWVIDSNLNLGLMMNVKTVENETVPKGLVRFSKGKRSGRQPLLVMFIDDSRPTRGTFSGHREGYNSYQLPIGPVSSDLVRSKRQGGQSASHHPSAMNGSCARYDLMVDFERIGWSAWIISPKGYNAFQCRGACHFPLGQNQRPTNHATVQSIVRELGMAGVVQSPCCVPDRLLSISLLYFDEQENVILKQYDDMVAAGCGCH